MDLRSFSLGNIAAFILVWYVLQAVADWKILSKAGKPGWLSLIPFLNVYSEYAVCWDGGMGIFYILASCLSGAVTNGDGQTGLTDVLIAAAGIAAAVIHIIQSIRLAKSFGKGTGYGILLVLFGPLMRMILGLGSSRYIGKP